MKNYTLTLLLTAAPLFAGTPAPVAPAPQYNSEQGWTLGLEAMMLRPFQSGGLYDKSDYDFGGRASLGYQFADGMFLKATYFGYGTDVTDYSLATSNSFRQDDGRMSLSYLDFVVGQNFKPTETLKLSPFVGLRWATFNEGGNEITTFPRQTNDTSGTRVFGEHNNFSGLGIVLGVDATRALGSGFSIYGNLKESVVFGTSDTGSVNYFYPIGSTTPSSQSDLSDSTDRVVFISEMGLGVQYDFAFSNVAANVRLGVEGQWWAGLSAAQSQNTGLAGFVLGANFRF